MAQGKKSVTTFVFALSVLIAIVPVQGVRTTCEMRTAGRSGVFYCKFSENIRETQRGFVVQRYNLTSSTKSPDAEILQCYWLAGSLKCPVKHVRYVFDMNVSDLLFLDVPYLAEDLEGKYVCQVIGNEDSDDEPCFYRIPEDHADLQNHSVKESGKSTLPPARTFTNSYKKDEIQDAGDIALVLVIVLIVTLAILAVVGLLWYCRKKGKIGRSVQKSTTVDAESKGPRSEQSAPLITDERYEELVARAEENKKGIQTMEETIQALRGDIPKMTDKTLKKFESRLVELTTSAFIKQVQPLLPKGAEITESPGTKDEDDLGRMALLKRLIVPRLERKRTLSGSSSVSAGSETEAV